MAIYSERSDDWVENLGRIHRKFDTARGIVPAPVIDYSASKSVGIISYGSNDAAIQEARDRMAADGLETNYMRIRALPFNDQVADFVKKHDRVYVVENNFDGQMWQILRIEVPGDTSNMISLALGDTLPMTARWVHTRIFQEENSQS
jgi:2-oxoglutarate ferredoxin oxidoreductase subunit alpha